MNQILRGEWLPWQRHLVWITRRAAARKVSPKPYNKFSVDQACSVMMAGYWPGFCFCVYMTLTPSRVNYIEQNSHRDLTLGQ